jgi:hypothetical protein
MSNYAEQILAIAKAYKEECFTDPENHTEWEALGILVAQATQWTGTPIFEVAISAFEDANYITFCAALESIWTDPAAGGDGH